MFERRRSKLRSATTRARTVASLLALSLAGAVIQGAPVQAATAKPRSPAIEQDKVVVGRDVGAQPRPQLKVPREYTAAAPSWPGASTTTVTLAPATTAQTLSHVTQDGVVRAGAPTSAPMVRVGTTPVYLRAGAAAPSGGAAAGGKAATSAAPGPASVAVHVYDHADTEKAGVQGVLMTLARTDGTTAPGQVTVEVDYSGFAGAYGADYASRLHLVELIGCGAASPVRTGCRMVALPSRVDLATHTVAASMAVGPDSLASAPREAGSLEGAHASAGTVSSGAVMLAATAGSSGGAGSFSATTLSPSATWSVNGNSGAFSWSYPLHSPPSVGGPAPALALSYNSSTVDGEESATNNQPSWIGEGFDLTTGYIERSYIPCAQDMGADANNTVATGDMCWSTNNLTLSLNGHAGDLIQDASNTDRWHLRNDDGTFIERLTGGGNAAQNGENWRVTTTDGTQYYFGSTPAANSTWTEPVYGNNPGEPCHQAGFAASVCTQAWRWNLDKIVDTSGNTMTYKYTAEVNEYAADDNASSPVSYIRGGYLTEIDYGTNTAGAGEAPERVIFTTGPRCITSSCGTHDATDWPDTPWDQQCTGAPCYNGSPTFWSDVMLNSISTQLYSGTGSAYTTVTTWTLGHAFPSPGDGSRAGLWLSSVQETGYDGGHTSSTPPVTFNPVQLANRVEPINGLAPMKWMRIAQITTESGAQIQVSYSPPQCVPGGAMPDVNNLQNNTLRCYPVVTPASGATPASTEFFNKYVVSGVNVADLTTPGNPTTTTSYTYVGNAAWHYTDDNGVVPLGTKTWSVWRGYGDVITTTGTGSDATTGETIYFQGMNGDHLPSGTRNVQLPGVDMNADGFSATDPIDMPAVNDDDALAGQVRDSIVRNGSTLVSQSVDDYWESAPTASRTASGITVNAEMTGVADTRTETILDGGRVPRTTSTHTDYDPVYGLPVDVEDSGDDAVSGDERCTLTSYDQNTSTDGATWLIDTPSRVQKYATTCATAKAGGLSAAQVVSDALTYYDGAASITTAPTRGLATRTDSLKDWVNSAPVYLTTSRTGYDGYGRPTSSTDVRGNTTTTAYATNGGGQVCGRTVTNALGWVTTLTLDPATGNTLTSTDPNGRVTAQAYDGLGRLTAVWQPGRDEATQSANTSYSYTVNDNAPSVVTTAKLDPSGGYVTTYALFDGLLRARQTQAPRGDGTAGALITDTLYDTAGRQSLTNAPYLVGVQPGAALFVPNQQSDVPKYTVETYDGAGRPSASTVYINSTGTPTVFSVTTTAYGGDRIDVTPPQGGTATSTIQDVHGNMIEKRQYHGTSPTPFTLGSYDSTVYRYDAQDRQIGETDGAGNTWSTTYDLRGRVVASSAPDTGKVTSTYDDAGDLISATDARGVTLAYTYDQLGRETALYQGTVSPADRLSSWVYDGLANSRGQLTASSTFVGGASGSAYTASIRGLTATYQPTAVQYVIPASETGIAGTYTYVYTYTVDGSPDTTRLPSLDGGNLPSETLTQGYSALGQPASLATSLPTATTLVPSVAYTGYGELAQMTLQTNGGQTAYLTRSYATGTRALSEQLVSRQSVPTTVADTRYAYDPNGDPISVDESVSGDNQCFSYDYADRLSAAWTPANGSCGAAPSTAGLGGPAPYWETWQYNTAGTRTSQTGYATANGTRTTTYGLAAPGSAQPHAVASTSTTDTTGTHTSAYTYDLAGDATSRPDANGATQTLTWNSQRRLAAVTGGGQNDSYVYDVNGNRLVAHDATGTTLYLPGQELRFTTATGGKATTRYYTEGGVTVADRTTAGLTWLFTDSQGTAMVTIDAATQNTAIRRQDPFGNPRGTASGTWPTSMDRGFVGGQVDPSGLTNLGAREYDPDLGRFISPDPLTDARNPQRLDPYAYSSQEPTRLSDPAGTSPNDSANDPPSGWFAYSILEHYGDVTINGIRYSDDLWVEFMCRWNGGLQCYGWDGNGQGNWVDVGDAVSESCYQGTCSFSPNPLSPYLLEVRARELLSVLGPADGTTDSTDNSQPVNNSAQSAIPPCPPPPPQPQAQPCQFFDWGCLTSNPGEWLGYNFEPLVEGITAVTATTICIVATAGVCGEVLLGSALGSIPWAVIDQYRSQGSFQNLFSSADAVDQFAFEVGSNFASAEMLPSMGQWERPAMSYFMANRGAIASTIATGPWDPDNQYATAIGVTIEGGSYLLAP